ncbi:hypothetical protein [Roseivivax sp. THAF197b]|uniref:hypothetical protein n=1 Tax=Roseivivax sp. THAF197b TaxID=2588299 RepID=UPI0012680F31|nr:hypothetical protein [Roseivivax sp. THAF197b]QFS82334.1 hypothetical protein FIV09_05800 [Roseivivax sp. THAF197b]
MKKPSTIILALAYSIIFSPLATAQEDFFAIEGDPSWVFLSKYREASVSINDQVSGGCWIDPTASMNVVQLELLRSSIHIEEGSFFTPEIFVSANGYAIDDYSCAANVKLKVWATGFRNVHNEELKLPSIYRYSLWSSSYLLTGSKGDMSSRITEAHQNLIRSFLVDLEKNSQAFSRAAVKDLDGHLRDRWLEYFEPDR